MRLLKHVKSPEELREELETLNKSFEPGNLPTTVEDWEAVHAAAKTFAHHVDVRLRLAKKLG